MKTQQLIPGFIYFDGNRGARRLLEITSARGQFDSQEARYEILAAAQENEFLAGGTKRSLIGANSGMSLTGFAAWARSGYPESEAQPLLDRLKAARIKLSPGEATLMESLIREFGELQAESPGSTLQSIWVSVEQSEARAVAGLAKKGMLIRDFDEGMQAATVVGRQGQTANDVKLTAIGIAWVAMRLETEAVEEEDGETGADRPKA